MKYTKLFMPLAVAATAISPVIMLTSCGGTTDITVDQSEIKTGDSLTTYKFKLPKVPTNKKVTVNIINKSETQEQVYIYEPYTSTNGELSTLECDVSDDGTVSVPVGYYLAPSTSSSSEFGLTFTYKDGDKEVTNTIENLKFDYNVDYGDDLLIENYPAQQAKDADYWNNKNVCDTYLADCLATPAIYQNDARYSTSKNIWSAKQAGSINGLKSFKAYFNDIVKQDDGVHIHMNYEVKGDSTSKLNVADYYEFSNFDFSFTYETQTGYVFESLPTISENYYNFRIRDISTDHDYRLLGRFNGSFSFKKRDSETGEWSDERRIENFDTVINNYDWGKTEDYQVASWLSFGIIALTYNFDFGAEETVLQLLSPYAANAPQANN